MYPEYDIWLGRVELNKDLQREAEAERRLHNVRLADAKMGKDTTRTAAASACLCLMAPGSPSPNHLR